MTVCFCKIQEHKKKTKNEPDNDVLGGTCLDQFALNVSTDFASKNFILFTKFLRTLLTGR